MIKYSKDGFEINHSRYLSDASTGLFFFVAIIFLARFCDLQIPFISDVFSRAEKEMVSESTKNQHQYAFSDKHKKNEHMEPKEKDVKLTEITVSYLADSILLFLLFLLHPAMGVIISVFSWFCLEYLYIHYIERFWWKNRIVAKIAGVEKELEQALQDFSLGYENWHGFLFNIEVFFQAYEVNMKAIHFRRSLRVMIRNISFIFLIFFAVLIFNKFTILSFLFAFLTISMLFLSGAIGNLSNIYIVIRYHRYYISETAIQENGS